MSFGRVAFLCRLQADPIEVLSAVAFVLLGSEVTVARETVHCCITGWLLGNQSTVASLLGC
jgi:hypothetical protein